MRIQRPTLFAGPLAAFVLLFSNASTPAAAQNGGRRYVDLVFDRVQRSNDLVYGTAVDKPTGRRVDLKLDLYEPAGDTAAARPVFVFLFGGGFVAGNKEQEPRAYCELMAKRGYVAAAISYRINQGNIATEGIPAAVSDTRQALRWLTAQAGARRLDPGRIVVGGSSAGAISSLFAAYTELEKTVADSDTQVALVMDLWGGLYTQVNDMTAGEPPLIIIHGTADTVVPYAEAEKLRARAQAVGIPHAFHPLAGKGHAPYMPAELMVLVADFAFGQLWPGGVATPAPTAPPTEPPTATAEPPTATPSPEPTSPPLPSATASTEPPPTAAPTQTTAGGGGRVFLPSLFDGLP